MMRYMRQNAVFVLVVVVLIVGVFIGTIFLVWGRGSLDSSGGGERSVVAWIGREEVPYADFLRAHDTRLEFYRRFYPNLSPGEIERRFKIRKGALDSVVGRRLLIDEAGRLGLAAAPEEIAAKIRDTEAFKENGAFSSARYREVLAASSLSPTAYEEEVRGEILVAKVRALAQEPARVSEDETFEAFRAEREKVRLDLIVIPAPDGSDGAVPEEEARRAFEADPGKYTRPERLRLAWFALRAQDQPPAPPPTDEELRAWYDANQPDFRTGRAVRARHILFRLPEGAPDAEEAKIRDRAGLVLAKAKGGTDFAALAKEFSQDTTGPRGGDLGWFEEGRMVPEFETAAFALAPGQVSDLVRTPYGIHIIKVEEARPAGQRSFEEARAEVAQRMAAARAREAVARLAEDVNEDLYTGEFEDVARRRGLTVATTDLLSREDPLPGAASRPDVADALFALREGDVSEFFRQGDDHFVYKVLAHRPAAVPSFAEARADVERDVRLERARSRATAAATAALGALRGGESPEAVAARHRAQVKETASFARREFVAEAGVSGEVFREAFAAGGAAGWTGPVALPDGRAALYRVAARVTASREEFAGEKEALAERLLAEKRDLLFESWLADLRRARAVKVNEALVGAVDAPAEEKP